MYLPSRSVPGIPLSIQIPVLRDVSNMSSEMKKIESRYVKVWWRQGGVYFVNEIILVSRRDGMDLKTDWVCMKKSQSPLARLLNNGINVWSVHQYANYTSISTTICALRLSRINCRKILWWMSSSYIDWSPWPVQLTCNVIYIRVWY